MSPKCSGIVSGSGAGRGHDRRCYVLFWHFMRLIEVDNLPFLSCVQPFRWYRRASCRQLRGYNRKKQAARRRSEETIMKFKSFTVTLALLALSFAAPAAFSQTPGTNPNDPGVSSAPPAPTSDPGVKPDSPADATTTPQTEKGLQPATVQPADPDKVKHDGSKKDVDAIGNRKVGGRGMGNWY